MALGYKGLVAFANATQEEYYARSIAYFDKVRKGMPFDFTLKNVVNHVRRMKEAQSIIEE